MSATPQQRPRRQAEEHRQTEGQQALAWFDEVLYESVEICSWCFSKIRDHEEYDTNTLGTGNRPSESLERTGDGTLGYTVETHNQYGSLRTHPPQTYCGTCGSAGGTDHAREIRSMQAMLRHGDAIIRRLHEAGYYPDIPYFYDSLERLKSDPDKQGKDREIFAGAAYAAVQRGRTR